MTRVDPGRIVGARLVPLWPGSTAVEVVDYEQATAEGGHLRLYIATDSDDAPVVVDADIVMSDLGPSVWLGWDPAGAPVEYLLLPDRRVGMQHSIL